MTNMRVSEQPAIANRLRGAFPASLDDDIAAVMQLIPSAQHAPTADDIGPIWFAGERLRIPFRFYSEIPEKLHRASLEPQQQTIISCIYSRHHSGYVRQHYTGPLIKAAQPWVVPFLLQLVGEYVCEIAELILDNLPSLNRDAFVRFATENPRFIELTRRRVISYWHLYYRSRFPRFTDYPGYQIMDAFDLWCDNISPRLLSR